MTARLATAIRDHALLGRIPDKKLAERMGVDQSEVCRIRQRAGVPSSQERKRLAIALDISTNEVRALAQRHRVSEGTALRALREAGRK